MQLSREGCLSLDIDEMRTVQKYFKDLGRLPTDIELESIAQTWSEHCVHKTLKGLIDYHGPEGQVEIDNLLKETIAKATTELNAPWCISVFTDNSGIIDFDEKYGVCLKVETHNHPSAIEPYGGANTGLGGVIRDILALVWVRSQFLIPTSSALVKSIRQKKNCHQAPFIRVVCCVGSLLGCAITVTAWVFQPSMALCALTIATSVTHLVFAGTGGLIEREYCFGDANVGDHVIVIGGRTGRDGIHGATFSSIELTDESEVVSSGAVQIGNPIEEKRVLDTFLQARDKGLFTATTDCGAGGISSAIGEMGEKVGVEVHLERVPLKYDGLTYTEVWISEAQERMVAAVPADKVEETIALFASEGVEATDVGTFTGDNRLRLYYHGEEVADITMDFLHDGLPRLHRRAEFTLPVETPRQFQQNVDVQAALPGVLARPNVASKEWIIRQYDHEVQGSSIIKPLVGVDRAGPSDGAVVAPILGP